MLSTIVSKLKNPVIAAATIANIIQILALLGFDAGNLEVGQKIAIIVIQIMVQIGVMTDAKS